MEFLRGLFSFYGRLNRREYAVALVIYFFFLAGLLLLEPYSHQYGDIGNLLAVVYVVVMFLVFLSPMAKRFHDFDQSGWSCLFILIPAIGAITPFVLLFYPGNPSTNAYGSPRNGYFASNAASSV